MTPDRPDTTEGTERGEISPRGFPRLRFGLPSISLFSGGFGLDLGLERAGFHVRVCVEKSRECVSTILANRPHLASAILNKDINDVSVDEILRTGKLRRGEVYLVAGGPPCQPFSTVGRRRSISSSEGKLFLRFLEIVWGIYPRAFIFENVRGILSAPIRHRRVPASQRAGRRASRRGELGTAWQFITRAFARELREGQPGGYRLHVWQMDASDYGVSQKRKRVFIVGVRGRQHLSKPRPTHQTRPSTLWKALARLKGRFERPTIDYLPYDKFRFKMFSTGQIQAGQNWRTLPVALQKKALGNGWADPGGKSGFCRRLAWDRPAPTITTDPAGRATNLCHPDKPRPLTVSECALIQGFPMSWKFIGRPSQQYTQIGNAVPVRLAQVIGRALMQSMQWTTSRKTS